MAYNVISSVISTYTNLKRMFLRTLSLGVTEVFTTEGLRFNHEFDIEFGNGETRYFLYQLPSDAQVTVGLQNRIFKSLNGEAEISILWESTGYTEGTLETVFNEYNKSIGGNSFRVSDITANAPTVEGVIRETDFLHGTGQGSHSSGDVSAELGFRLYAPDTFFIAKVTNLENSTNRIILSYSWVEIPESELTL